MIAGLLIIGLLQAAPNAPTVEMASMTNISGATFLMGTPGDLMVGRYGDGWYVNETPQRDVTLDPFAMDQHEVSVDEFALFLTHSCGEACYDSRMPIDQGPDGFHSQEAAGSLPITWVDWRSASWYCEWAGKRLPTEPEWELAAAGAEARPWPWGSETGPRCGFSSYSFDGGRCDNGLRAREAHIPGETPDGIRNLSGNAAEWTSDVYAAYPSDAASNQPGPPADAHRVIRGGSFLTSRRQLQPRSRRGAPLGTRSVDLGFRCAWDDSIVDPPGVHRGELERPNPEGLAPRTEPSEDGNFEVVLAGLNGARALLIVDNAAYIAGNESVYIWRDGATTEVEDLTINTWTTDGVSAFGVDTENSTLWRFSGGEVTSELEAPGLLSALPIPGSWAWTDGSTIWSRGLDGTDVELVGQRTDINKMVVLGDTLYWSEGGSEGGAILGVPLQGGEATQRVGPPQLRQPLKAWGLAADADVRLWFMIGLQSQWPFSGLLCSVVLPDGRLECLTHSPPKASSLSVSDGAVYWRHQYGVSGLSGSRPYTSLGDPVSPTGFMLTPEAYWVTETATGRLLRLMR